MTSIARRISLAAFALAPLAACAPAVQAPAGPPADLAIVHVNVVDVRAGRILPDQTVLVDDGEIRAVAPSTRRAPAATRTVDGRGAYLLPGLWDMHAHLRGNGTPEWITTEWLMPLLVAHGVTGVREMNADCESPRQGPVCLAQMQDYRARIEAGTLLGPRLLALSSWQVNPPWDYEVTEEQARQLVGVLDEQGVDLVKVYFRLSPAAFGWIADEARARGLPFAGHVPLRVSSLEASEAGMRSVEHARDFLFDCFPGAAEFRRTATSQDPPAEVMRAMVDRHDAATCDRVFRAFVRNGTAYVPTHVTRRMEAFAGDSAFLADPRARFIPPMVMQGWRADAGRVAASEAYAAGTLRDFYGKGREITGAAHRAGVTVLLGTDAPDSFVFPGSGVHDELGELVAAGLTPAEALRAATWGPAEFLGRTDRFGTVEAGKAADLLLVGANPLEDVGHARDLRAVVFRGELLDRARLDALLAEAEAVAQRPMGPGS